MGIPKSVVSLASGLSVLLLCAGSCCWSKDAPPKTTVAQLQDLIKRDLPIGSSRGQVAQFLQTLDINSLKVASGSSPGRISGLVLEVQRHCKTFSTDNISMTFYIDSSDRLTDYTVELSTDSF